MSSCLGVLLELRIPDLLAKEDKPIALKEVRQCCLFVFHTNASFCVRLAGQTSS